MDTLNLFIEPFIRIIPRLPEAAIDLVIGYLIIYVTMGALNKFLKVTKMPQLRGIIISLSKFALWVILLIFIANNLGFNKFALALSGSVLVIAFILNTGIAPLVTDVLAGLFLCTDPDFKTGSKVKLGSGETATEGIIREVDMRKVRVVDSEGKIHVFPNSVVEKNEWVVLEQKDATAKRMSEKAKEIIAKRIKK